MNYKLISRENPRDRDESKLYAAPVNDGRISVDDLAREIVDLSSLSRGDVSNVIKSFIDVTPKYLLMGKSVSLGELGTMRVSFSSDGVDDAKDFHVSKIKGVKIIFTPGVELKDKLTKIHFEHNGEIVKDASPTTPPEEDPNGEG
jgi:predicted histone-like DNA-binding protein